jgi:hypothetical protein
MSKSNLFIYVLALVCLVLGAAWIVSQKKPHFEPISVVTDGPYTLQVQLDSGQATILKPNAFTVSIKEANQLPVSGATVNITLSMPDMFCGSSTAAAKEIEPGIYLGEGIPLMAGPSSAEVSIAFNGQTYKVQHPFLAVH